MNVKDKPFTSQINTVTPSVAKNGGVPLNLIYRGDLLIVLFRASRSLCGYISQMGENATS